jgi:predicted anti-sigma-YlaC factor YlaD
MKTTRTARIPSSKCDSRIRGLFIPYLNDDVTSRQRIRIHTHLRKCSECRSELLLMYSIKSTRSSIRARD